MGWGSSRQRSKLYYSIDRYYCVVGVSPRLHMPTNKPCERRHHWYVELADDRTLTHRRM